MDLGGEERFLVQSREEWMRGEKPGHLRIEVDQGNAFDLRILERLAHGQAVAAAKHQHMARSGYRRESGVHERFVVAIFIAGAELKMRIEEEANVVLPASEHNVLIAGVAGKDDFIGVDVVFGQGRKALARGQRRSQQQNYNDAERLKPDSRLNLLSE